MPGSTINTGDRGVNASLWARTKAVAGEALELAHEKRDAFVEAACAGDAELLTEVRALLRASVAAPGTLAEEGVPATVLADAVHVPSVTPGAMIGRYRIGRALGSGGMGAVFEATDTTLDRRVALKLLSIGLASTGARRRFETEAMTLARLDHSGIARVYEAGVHHAVESAISVPFIAMTFVEDARTLDAYVREVRLDMRGIIALFARVCDAVHHGHQKSVLHRDLKPSNILVDKKGDPHVIDFGIARMLDSSGATHATHAGELMGTPAYLPPEAFEHGVQSLDTRGDVYALGVVLYEVLAGSNPFIAQGLTPMQVGGLVRGRPPALLGSKRAECTGDVETIVAKAMAREAEDRYQSAEQLGADLRRVLAYEPIIAKPAPLSRQALLFARRNRGVMAVAVIVVLAVGMGIAGLWVGLSRARASERRALAEAHRAQQVSAFVTQMLRSASPFQGEQFRSRLSMDPISGIVPPWPSTAIPGRAPTVGDLLAVAAEQVEQSFPDDPALQADVAATLAQTSSWLSDPRSPQLTARAADLLTRAYGRDDPRSLVARQFVYLNSLFNNHTTALVDMERDLAVIRALQPPPDERLLRWAWSNHLQCLTVLGREKESLPVLLSIRTQLDDHSAADSPHKLALDLAILRVKTGADAALGLAAMPGLLERAHALDNGEGEQVLAVLFDTQIYQRRMGDNRGALATLVRGAATSTGHFGGMDQGTYEWWSGMYTVAMQMDDYAVAEHAAREQLRGAEAMLGPHSWYTTKAYGRLARTLLALHKDLPEAERAARSAVEGAPDLLAAGEDWALYHEVLWAWSVRLQGDAHRAEKIIRDRMKRETRAGRQGTVAWVEVVRFTELAQCAMDQGQRADDITLRTEDIEDLLRVAERHATQLGPDWPSVRLTAAARARWEALKGP